MLSTLYGRGQTIPDHILSMDYFTRKTSSRLNVCSLIHLSSEPTNEPSSSPLSLRALAPPALKCGSCLKHLFGVGGERGRRERSQFFPAAAANQSKLPTQTAHSTAGATPKPYLWVQSYCDTFPMGCEGRNCGRAIKVPDDS